MTRLTYRFNRIRDLLLAGLLLIANHAFAAVVSFAASGTTQIVGSPNISLTYTSSPIGITNSVTAGLCEVVDTPYTGGGVFPTPSSPPVCVTAPIQFVPNLSTISTTPETELMAYPAVAVQQLVNDLGHGGQAWILREFTDMATSSAQSIVHPIRVYSQNVLPITLVSDAGTVSGASGGNVVIRGNDSINGFQANAFNLVYSISNAAGITGLTIASGELVIPPGQAVSGLRNVVYSACQAVTNTTNCQTATAAVTLIATVIAVPDTVSTTTLGGTTNLLTNDTFNGLPATSSNVSATFLTPGGLVGAATINPAGQLIIPAGHPTGSFGPTYTICDLATPANCSSPVAVTVTVTAVPIVANADTSTLTAGGGLVSVLVNDIFNAAPATVASVTVTIQNNGGIAAATVNGTGQIVIPAGLAAGPYTLIYRICETASPANCATANINLTISATPIIANPDTVSLTTTGGLATVLANDTLNAAPATAATVTVTIQNNGGIAAASVNASGQIVIPTGVAASAYALVYRICEIAAPANCANGNLTLTVNAVLVSAGADATSVPASGGSLTILSNDTINGVAADVVTNADVTLLSNGGISASIDGAGVLNIAGGNPGGTYILSYRLCQKATANCQTTSVTVTVFSTLVGGPDMATVSNAGGTVNILANDSVGGAPANIAANADVTLISNGGISAAAISASGQLVIPANIASASYSLTYQLCQKNTANCVTVTVTLGVIPPASAATDVGTVGGGGGLVNILANDQISGQPATPANADVTIVSNGGVAGASINTNGQLVIPNGLVAGVYTITYRLCQRGTNNCVTSTVTLSINVSAGRLILAADRAVMPPAGGTLRVSANDTIDGRAPTANELLYTLVNSAGINNATLSAAGDLSVPRGLGRGAYQITYRACQRQLPTNCANASAFVTITQSVSSVVTNRPPSVPGAPPPSGTVTAIGPGGTPITFVTGSTSNVAGSINDPIIFSDVKIVFGEGESGKTQAFYQQGDAFENFGAQLYYSGSGVIRGRWEVVYPGDPAPTEIDLFTEASLPENIRTQQQRFFQIERVQEFLAPTGRFFLKGPDPARLPRNQLGSYLILLRLEAVPSTAGVAGGMAPFPFPVLEYNLQTTAGDASVDNGAIASDGGRARRGLSGSSSASDFSTIGELPRGALALQNAAIRANAPGMRIPRLGPAPLNLMLPSDAAIIRADQAPEFSWADMNDAARYQFELETAGGKSVLQAPIKPGVGRYIAPPFVREEVGIGALVRWRVVGFNANGKKIGESEWRSVRFE